MTLYFDVTQYANQPNASGIQRVLLQLAVECGDHDRFVVYEGDQILILTPSVVEQALRHTFGGASTDVSVIEFFRARSLGVMMPEELIASQPSYVIAELSYRADLLRWWARLLETSPDRLGAIFYDAAPENSRQLFGSPPAPGASAYFRLIARIPKVACISYGAREELAHLGNRDPATIDVVPLGGDHLNTVVSDDARRFVVIGDLKAKKRVDIALAAFQMVADEIDHELVILGRAIVGEDSISQAVSSAVGPRVRWLKGVSDVVLSDALSGATASIFVATSEGFGLPVLESIHAGVPVIVDEALPALAFLDPVGQIRLGEVTVDSVAQAMRVLGGPDGSRFRQLARETTVHSWAKYCEDLRNVFEGPLK